MNYIVIIIVVILVICLMYYFITYNNFVKLNNKVKESFINGNIKCPHISLPKM